MKCNKSNLCSWICAFSLFIFFLDQDKSLSTQCTLMTENECWISFNVVAGETGTTAYNLQIYGEVCVSPGSQWSQSPCEWESHLVLFPRRRLSGSSQNAHHHSGGLPLHRVHWSDLAGGVEGTGVSSWPQRGGQVRGGEVKGKMAVGKNEKSWNNGCQRKKITQVLILHVIFSNCWKEIKCFNDLVRIFYWCSDTAVS